MNFQHSESFQVITKLIFACLVAQICGVFSNGFLPSSSGGYPVTVALACTAFHSKGSTCLITPKEVKVKLNSLCNYIMFSLIIHWVVNI